MRRASPFPILPPPLDPELLAGVPERLDLLLGGRFEVDRDPAGEPGLLLADRPLGRFHLQGVPDDEGDPLQAAEGVVGRTGERLCHPLEEPADGVFDVQVPLARSDHDRRQMLLLHPAERPAELAGQYGELRDAELPGESHARDRDDPADALGAGSGILQEEWPRNSPTRMPRSVSWVRMFRCRVTSEAAPTGAGTSAAVASAPRGGLLFRLEEPQLLADRVVQRPLGADRRHTEIMPYGQRIDREVRVGLRYVLDQAVHDPDRDLRGAGDAGGAPPAASGTAPPPAGSPAG